MSEFENRRYAPPANVVVKPSRHRLTLIWMVPLIAALIGLGLAIKAVMERGTEITLQFASAEGLEANKTRIRYKDVDIGVVKGIALAEDRASVRVSAQIGPRAEGMLVEDTRFWVVRPRVAAGNVSGLATLFSGAYIGVDAGKSSEARREFVGMEVPPIMTSGLAGRQFQLKATDLGSLDIGAPVYYRRIMVGRVVAYEMADDGGSVNVRVFVDAPYDKFVDSDTRFWHASGVDFSLDANGVKVDTQSLVSILMGGITFDNRGHEGDQPAAHERTAFILHADRLAAMRTLDSRIEKYVLLFRESVRGLTVGAPVDFRGLVAGEVTHIDLDSSAKNHDFLMAVEIDLYPDRVTRPARARGGKPVPVRAALDAMVAQGFRGQLRTGNLLTGQRYVALDFFPRSKPSRINWATRLPGLPTEPGTLDALQDKLTDLAATLQSALESMDSLLKRLDKETAPEVASTLRTVRQTLATADKLLASDSPMQQDMRETLREVGRAAQSLRQLADLLERQPEALLTGKKGDSP